MSDTNVIRNKSDNLSKMVQIEIEYHEASKEVFIKTNKIETKSTSLDKASEMVKLAKEKGWQSISVEGDSKFKKQVWEKASEYGMKVEGYAPSQSELTKVSTKVLAKEFIKSPEEAAKKYPELKGSLNVIKAIEEKNIKDGLTKKQMEFVNDKAKEIMAGYIEKGNLVKSKEHSKEHALTA